MDPIKAREKIEQCLAHADDLIRSAKSALETDKLPNIAYHLATLALEEIGKAGFFAVFTVPERREHAQEYFEKKFEDHYQKLVWAIWTPLLTGRKPFTQKDFQQVQELARNIHETRQLGMYVNSKLTDTTAPIDAISETVAKTHIDFVEGKAKLASH